MVKTIKFDKKYCKLWFVETDDRFAKTAKLIQIFEVETKNLTAEFIEYDMEYFNSNHDVEMNSMPLEPRMYLLILDYYGNTIMTLRKINTENTEKYCQSVGKEFRLKIEVQK